jgi:hypothetical protein
MKIAPLCDPETFPCVILSVSEESHATGNEILWLIRLSLYYEQIESNELKSVCIAAKTVFISSDVSRTAACACVRVPEHRQGGTSHHQACVPPM